jgi:adenylyltransferase/sulfurtransferase
MFKRLLPKQVSEKLANGEQMRFIDVREPFEHAIAYVEGAELTPLSTLHDWVDTLKKDEEIVVMCHHGVRSANLCMFLTSNGFQNVSNLEGGIDLWSLEVDSSVPRY